MREGKKERERESSIMTQRAMIRKLAGKFIYYFLCVNYLCEWFFAC